MNNGFKNGANIRLIATDLDGTLLYNDKSISPRNSRILQQCAASGIYVMAATGRPLNAIPESFLGISGIRYLMSANGANIYDMETGETIYRALMTKEQVERILAFLEPMDVWHEILIDGKSYVEEKKYQKMERYVRRESMEYLLRTRTPVRDLHVLIEEKSTLLEKVCCFFRTPEEKKQLQEAFPLTEDLCGLEASDVNYEISDRHSTKGQALLFMKEYLQLKKGDLCVAFGDALNDAPLLKNADLGIAMGNAYPELKEIAHRIALSNEEDGVGLMLEELLCE